MPTKFDHVLWLGGTTCSGKTTTAELLARHSNWRLYSTDDTFAEHLHRAAQSAQPSMYDFGHTRGWVEWVKNQAVDVQVDIWVRFYRERFSLILEDVDALGRDPILMEGVELYSDCILPYADIGRAAWIVPTRCFFERHYYTRPWITEPPSEETWTYYETMIAYIRGQVQDVGGLLVENDVAPPEAVADMLDGTFWSSLGRADRQIYV